MSWRTILFKTACEQPGNSPYGAWECDVTEALLVNFLDKVWKMQKTFRLSLQCRVHHCYIMIHIIIGTDCIPILSCICLHVDGLTFFYFSHCHVNTLRPRPNGRHFPADSFKCIFLNENAWFAIKISLKFVPKGSINNIPTLVQIMAWRRPGDKPLSEPMLVCFTEAYICHSASMS